MLQDGLDAGISFGFRLRASGFRLWALKGFVTQIDRPKPSGRADIPLLSQGQALSADADICLWQR